jgi:mono/diheme cytochrome c family protein
MEADTGERDNVLRTLLLGTLAYLVVVGAVALYLVFSGKIESRTDPNDPARVAKGEKVYEEHCQSCHAEALRGEPNWQTRNADGSFPAPPLDETGHSWEHSDRQIFDYIKFGGRPLESSVFKSNMPGFEDSLTNDQIWASLTFIKSRWPEAIRKRQASTSYVHGLHLH